jgi:hypothetical protein
MNRRSSTNTAKKALSLQNAIEAVEALSPEEQSMVMDIILRRLMQQKRADLVQRVAEARADFGRGKVRRGAVADLLAEIDS